MISSVKTNVEIFLINVLSVLDYLFGGRSTAEENRRPAHDIRTRFPNKSPNALVELYAFADVMRPTETDFSPERTDIISELARQSARLHHDVPARKDQTS